MRWRATGMALLLPMAVALLVMLLFHETTVSIVSIWHRSQTFSYGFVVPPIAAWLAWRRRDHVAGIPVSPRPAWSLALLVLGFTWFLGRMASVLVVEQYTFALMIPSAIAVVLGPGVVRALLFPMGFLLLGIPGGDIIVPPLISFTAGFAVKALQVSGVPVVRTGDFVTLPGCEWAVSDACSGFRYLMASLTLGCLYANLRFRTWRYRLFFVGLSFLVPIIANGIRAYVIVMLGYLSNMRVAVGVDHFIYGWLLFAAFSLLLFWIGSRMHEPATVATARPAAPAVGPGPVQVRRVAWAAGLAVLAMAIWPAYASHVTAAAPDTGPVPLSLPAAAGPWRGTLDPLSLWKPDYRGAASEAARAYRRGDRVVVLYVAYYRHQGRGSKLVTTENEIVRLRNREWRRTGSGSRDVFLGGRRVRLLETRTSSANENLLVWHRYWVRGRYNTDPYITQLLELRERMLAGKDDAALVAVATPYDKRTEGAAEELRDFLATITPSLDASLRRASEGP